MTLVTTKITSTGQTPNRLTRSTPTYNYKQWSQVNNIQVSIASNQSTLYLYSTFIHTHIYTHTERRERAPTHVNIDLLDYNIPCTYPTFSSLCHLSAVGWEEYYVSTASAERLFVSVTFHQQHRMPATADKSFTKVFYTEHTSTTDRQTVETICSRHQTCPATGDFLALVRSPRQLSLWKLAKKKTLLGKGIPRQQSRY